MSSTTLTDVPHSDTALTPETRAAPDEYQVRREQSGYDARAAARALEQEQRERASNEQLRHQSTGPPGTWTPAAPDDAEPEQSVYSSASGRDQTSRWQTDESAVDDGQEYSSIFGGDAYPGQEPDELYEGEEEEYYGQGQTYGGEEEGYGEREMYEGEEGMYQQQMYQGGEQQMYQQGERQMYQQGEQQIYQEGEQQMYQQGEEQMYQQGEQQMYQEGEQQMYQEGEQPVYQGGDEADQPRMYVGADGIYPVSDEAEQPQMYVGADGIYPIPTGVDADGVPADATSPDVSSLRTADLSSLGTSDVSTARSSELSALTGGVPAGETFDSTNTAYQGAPGDPGDPALAGQFIALDDSAGASLSRGADSTLATAASRSLGSMAGSEPSDGAPPPDRSGTSGVYSEPSQSVAAVAAAAASDAYMQRYSEVMEKLSEVQQRRDDLMRSYSSVAGELATTRSSTSGRPRPPPTLSRASVEGMAPHELSTIQEGDATGRSRTPLMESGGAADAATGQPGDVTSTGSLLSRTGPPPGGAPAAAGQDDTLSQLSNLTSSQEYFSQESPRPGSAAAVLAQRSGPLAALGSTSEVSLRSSALERALEASREAIRSVSGGGSFSTMSARTASTGGGVTAPARPTSGASSPDVGAIISKLGMRSRSGPLAAHANSSGSSSGSPMQPADFTIPQSDDED
ncbi:uncharacterized protein LOC119112957 [Pollicipes pollicipes]|uniref:uncharacterized protein LOC119112957 n=1 Tax=Pollicipes pollicipes TaxID=41117 RepID=UPI0018854857|nr:uncharacterized protein LOC119112957 [Pollicipes pollicipes]